MDRGLLVVLDQQVGLTNGIVGRGKLLAMHGHELLDTLLLLGRVCAVEEVLFRHG